MNRIEDGHASAWRNLLAAQSRLVGVVEDALVSAGLPPLSWYDVLLPLNTARRPLRMRELAAEVVTIGRTGLTRLTDRLEASGVIIRQHCLDDRRGVEVAITPEGKALLKKMAPVYAAVIETQFAARLSERDARTLAELLARVAEISDPPEAGLHERAERLGLRRPRG